MRIKDHKRLSAVGTIVFVAVLCLGGGMYFTTDMKMLSVALIILGVAGAIVSSTAIRLYGRMSMDAVLKGTKKIE